MGRRGKKISDMTGNQYGKLKVLRRLPEDYVFMVAHKLPQWECLCDCGKIVVIKGYDLKNVNNRRSCGCLRKEATSKRMKKTWEVIKEYKEQRKVS